MALDHLERNPRQAKRFHNVFRLQVYVAAGEGVVVRVSERLFTLARWIAMRPPLARPSSTTWTRSRACCPSWMRSPMKNG